MREVKISQNLDKYNNHPTFNVFGRGEDGRIAGKLIYHNPNNGIPTNGYSFQALNPEEYALTPETLEQIVVKIRFLNRAVEAGIL